MLTASATLPAARYPDADDLCQFYGRAMAAIRALPGVRTASLTSTVPFGSSSDDAAILAEGYQMSVASPNRIVVAPGYFETLGIPLVAGRFFDQRDRADAPRTVIVDQRLARRYWPGRSPLGRRMYLPSNSDDPLAVDEHTVWLTVAGVVGDTKLRSLLEADQLVGTYYYPIEQSAPRSSSGLDRCSRKSWPPWPWCSQQWR